MPRVSVVMPAYNAEKYIGEAIDSILNQTYTDFEFIIINDGSTDRTKEIILSYTDPRIVYLENEQNSGIVVTLNKGLDCARGEYIARMDADDIAVSERLTKQVAVMDRDTSIGVLATGLQTISAGRKGNVSIPITDPRKLHTGLLFSSCIAHPTVIIRSAVLKENKLRYDSRFEGREDYALWWNIAKVSKISAIPEVLHYYRIHNSQITQASKDSRRKKAYAFYMYRMESLGVVLSDDENRAVFRYCFGEDSSFDKKTLNDFSAAIVKIIRKNKKTAYFLMRNLKEECSLAIIRIASQSKMDKHLVHMLLTELLLKGCCSLNRYAKCLYHLWR